MSGTRTLWRLIRRVGTNTMRVHRMHDEGWFAIATTDCDAAIKGLVRVLNEHHDDHDLCVQAMLFLGGDELVPLEEVIPALVPCLQDGNPRIRHWAACALEAAAPRPGNESLTEAPSHPLESLGRLAEIDDRVGAVALQAIDALTHTP